MQHLHFGLSATGLCIALSLGSLAASGTASAADASIQTNRNGEVVSHASTATLQRALADHKSYQGKIDGVWGPRTEAALRQYQSRNGLDVTGTVDDRTAEKLGLEVERMDLEKGASERKAPVGVRSATDDPDTSVQLSALNTDQVKEMQQRLQLLGYYRGPIDGAVGPGTREALRKFFDHQADLAAKGSVSNAAISLFGTQPDEIQRVSGSDKR
jgi:peptidoglycan hydrolase-like protein with peptidoglycan-binding domain